MNSLTHQKILECLPTLLANIPEDWIGTTYKNASLLGREQFCENLAKLMLDKGNNINTQDLTDIGNAEDYFRVSNNLSCVLEMVLAVEKELKVNQVFTFASTTMPIISVLLNSKKVHLYLGDNPKPFNQTHLDLLIQLGCSLELHQGTVQNQQDDIVLSMDSKDFDNKDVHGIILPNILYIINENKINSSKILIIRKRLSTPLTTPVCIEMLQQIAKVEVTANQQSFTIEEYNEFYSHLQTCSGTEADADNFPVCFTAGLPAICSFWLSLISNGGADILMASTAYGGSSELTDILTARTDNFRKHKFDITGKNKVTDAIENLMNSLDVSQLLPTTVVFVEIPTNPDMKVPDIEKLAKVIDDFQQKSQKEIVLFIDTTFAPGSQIMKKISLVAPNLTTIIFISLSKSISRGTTTAGTIVAGSTKKSQELLKSVRQQSEMLDTQAKKDQLVFLCNNHHGVEQRCQNAYNNAFIIGQNLQKIVKEVCDGYEMELNFVSEDNASQGFTTSTYSFNLPPAKGKPHQFNEELAQKFVTNLSNHKEFKPCVSFGQDNNIVYATVPATSTQGAIKAEDKAKQAVGGVQLARLSFPPTCDVEAINKIIENAVKICYQE